MGGATGADVVGGLVGTVEFDVGAGVGTVLFDVGAGVDGSIVDGGSVGTGAVGSSTTDDVEARSIKKTTEKAAAPFRDFDMIRLLFSFFLLFSAQ